MFPYGNTAGTINRVNTVRRFIDTTERLAEVVRVRRHEQGWTQAELAVRAGVGRRFVVDLEAGHPRAELAKTLQVLAALGVQPLAVPVPPPTTTRPRA